MLWLAQRPTPATRAAADRRGDLLIDIAALLLIVSAVAAIGGVMVLLLMTP